MFKEEILLGNRKAGKAHPCFIVAELSGNHNGDINRAYQLIKAAKEAGADAVKLQTYTADTLTIDCDNEYFKITEGPWKGKKLYELYHEAATPWEWHKELFAYAGEQKITAFSTPFDVSAVDFLEQFNLPCYKIASFEMVDYEFVKYVAARRKPIIVSTGMATKEEVGKVVEVMKRVGNEQLILLKCTSAYPAPLDSLNLSLIPKMYKEFGALVGLSDHSAGTQAATIAVALGACVIEKHITLNRADGGVDSAFSLNPDEFKNMVQAVRETEAMLGGGKWGRGVAEEASLCFRRSLFVVKDIAPGEKITRDNVRTIRPGYGLSPDELPDILGKKAKIALKRGTPLKMEYVEL
jgi:pseudaminic acid synthase